MPESFDPNKYLNEEKETPAFDPNAYLGNEQPVKKKETTGAQSTTGSTEPSKPVAQPSSTNGIPTTYSWSTQKTETPLATGGVQGEAVNVNPVTGTKQNPFEAVFSNQKKAQEELQKADIADYDIKTILANEQVKKTLDIGAQIQTTKDPALKQQLQAKYDQMLAQPAQPPTEGLEWSGFTKTGPSEPANILKGKTIGDAIKMLQEKGEEFNSSMNNYTSTATQNKELIAKMRQAADFSVDPDKGYKEIGAVENFFRSSANTITGMTDGFTYLISSPEERKQFLNRKLAEQQIFPMQPYESKGGVSGFLYEGLVDFSGMMGSVAPYMLAGGIGGEVGGTLGSMVANSVAMGAGAYSQAAQEAYAEKLKETGNEDEALAAADAMAKVGAGIGVAEGVAMGVIPGGKMPKSVRDYVINTAQKNTVLGALFAGGRYLENKLAQAQGINRDQYSGVKDAMIDGVVLGVMMDAVHTFKGAVAPKVRNEYENIIAKYAFTDVREAVDNAVQKGVMDYASAEKLMAPIEKKAAAFSAMPKGLSAAEEAKVLPKVMKINDLNAANEKLAPAFQEANNREIERINREIMEDLGTPLDVKEQKRLEELKSRGTQTDKEGKAQELTASEKEEVRHFEARETAFTEKQKTGKEEANKAAQDIGYDHARHLLNDIKKEGLGEYERVQDVPEDVMARMQEKKALKKGMPETQISIQEIQGDPEAKFIIEELQKLGWDDVSINRLTKEQAKELVQNKTTPPTVESQPAKISAKPEAEPTEGVTQTTEDATKTVVAEQPQVGESWEIEFERAKSENDLAALDTLYNKVKVALNGLAQGKGEATVRYFEDLKQRLESYSEELKGPQRQVATVESEPIATEAAIDAFSKATKGRMRMTERDKVFEETFKEKADDAKHIFKNFKRIIKDLESAGKIKLEGDCF